MHILEDPVVSEIAKVHGKTAAQVLIRFGLQRNLVVVPKNIDLTRIKESVEVGPFSRKAATLATFVKIPSSFHHKFREIPDILLIHNF